MKFKLIVALVNDNETELVLISRMSMSTSDSAIFLSPRDVPDDVFFQDKSNPGDKSAGPSNEVDSRVLWHARLFNDGTDPGVRVVSSPDLRPDFVFGDGGGGGGGSGGGGSGGASSSGSGVPDGVVNAARLKQLGLPSKPFVVVRPAGMPAATALPFAAEAKALMVPLLSTFVVPVVAPTLPETAMPVACAKVLPMAVTVMLAEVVFLTLSLTSPVTVIPRAKAGLE